MVALTGGMGTANSSADGGDGGPVVITGGEALGLQNRSDHGGEVKISGGRAKTGFGGGIEIMSGEGVGTSSGTVLISTAEAGASGVSCGIFFRSQLLRGRLR